MVTSFLIKARDCAEIDPERITAAGGHLIGVGCLEDDGTVKVDIDVAEDYDDANRRLARLFAHPHTGAPRRR